MPICSRSEAMCRVTREPKRRNKGMLFLEALEWRHWRKPWKPLVAHQSVGFWAAVGRQKWDTTSMNGRQAFPEFDLLLISILISYSRSQVSDIATHSRNLLAVCVLWLCYAMDIWAYAYWLTEQARSSRTEGSAPLVGYHSPQLSTTRGLISILMLSLFPYRSSKLPLSKRFLHQDSMCILSLLISAT
jgi:hypothetical protein